MTDEDYFNLGIKKILGPQQGINSNQNINIGQNSELSPEQILINSLLEPRSLKIEGSYQIDSQGNEVQLTEIKTGTVLSKEGYPIELHKKYFFTLADGSSLGETAECMNCLETVHKDNLFRCPICGVTCCVLCDTFSGKTQNHYCCNWHKIKCEGLF